jgi:hypothetical protein
VRNRYNGGFRSGSFADIRRKISGEQPVSFWYLPVMNEILIYAWGSRTKRIKKAPVKFIVGKDLCFSIRDSWC